MSISTSYLTIIIVWSTTPLAIAWSSNGLSPISALGMRMALAAVVGWLLLRMLGLRISWEARAVKTYGYSQLGIVGAMLCVYSAAQYIPSGLISVLFALSPMLSSLFAYFLLGEKSMTGERIVAYLVSFTGLGTIFLDNLFLEAEAWKGIVLLLIGVSLYSLSGVKVQQIGYRGNPLSITVASVILSVPLFAVAWMSLDGVVPVINFDEHAIYAVIYLAILGSLIGFCAYFYLLREAGASAVAMITLITPALALMLGAALNGEVLGLRVYLGTALILTGLFLYHRRVLLKGYLRQDIKAQV